MTDHSVTTPGAASTGPGRPRVLVAVLTYRRPTELGRALDSLGREVTACTAGSAGLLVVDNDPDGGARAAVTDRGVDYHHEPTPGIAAARNAALDVAASRAVDAVVFVDDDETVTDGWLESLTAAWREWGCAAVAGPAVRTLDGDVSGWVRRSGFFDHPVRERGATVAGAATNNLLLDLHVLRALGLRFDERFGLTGGSDTMLTRTLSASGHEIRWCPEARVLDPVPAERATRRWVLRRAYRTGTTWSRVHLALRAAARGSAPRSRVLGERVRLSVRAVGRIVSTTPALLGGVRRDGVADPAAACRAASGAGMLLGAWGASYVEYSRSSGG